MAASYKTPGVYIVEKNAFPNTIVEVETAVPAFIGYTETAENNKVSLHLKPTRITSFAEFLMYFGNGPNNGAPRPTYDMSTNGEIKFSLNSGQYLLYSSLRLFYANGGGPCYIVSVGTYGDTIEMGQQSPPKGLLGGLTPLLKEQEPTMVVVPDAVRLGSPTDCYTVYNEVLLHCQKMQSRVGIFDVYDGFQAPSGPGIQKNVIDDFRDGVQQALNYGAAYYPWLETNIIGDAEFDFRNLTTKARQDLGSLITKEVGALSEQANKVQNAKVGGASSPQLAGQTLQLLESSFPNKEAADKAVEAKQTALKNSTDALAGALGDPATIVAITPPLAEAEKIAPANNDAVTAVGAKTADALAPEDVATLNTAVEDVIKKQRKATADALNAYKDAGTGKGKKEAAERAVQVLQALEPGLNVHLASAEQALGALQTAKANQAAIQKRIDDANTTQITDPPPDPAQAEADARSLHESLLAVSPVYRLAMDGLKKAINVMPTAGAMAGVYTRVDNNIGVFKAPANTGLVSVVSPTVNITHDEQEDLNVPLNGKAVNAIRAFPGYGVLVWGARTLDGNSQDWRYINVRRTLIMLEQSIKAAMQAYVFEPNVSTTWSNVKSMIDNFLTNQWKAGALAGASPAEAFEVHIGLGATMTSNDILDGYMRATVKVAVVRPAEFIVLTFQQKVQTS